MQPHGLTRRGAGPAFGDVRVVDRSLGACFRGELVERPDARFAVPDRTSGSAASLVLSPTLQALENRPRPPVRNYVFAMRRPSMSLLLRGEMTRAAGRAHRACSLQPPPLRDFLAALAAMRGTRR